MDKTDTITDRKEIMIMKHPILWLRNKGDETPRGENSIVNFY